MKEEDDGGNMKDLEQHKRTARPSSAGTCGGFAAC